MLTTSFLETFGLVTDLGVVAVLVKGLASILLKTAEPARDRVRFWAETAILLLVWYGVATYLAHQGVFQASRTVKLPALPFGVFLPIILGLWWLSRKRILNALLDATPITWLIGVQVYRVIGVIFLLLLGEGQLPPEFAIPAGIGDLLVGVLALPVAWAAHRGTRTGIRAAYVWNGLGILDFVVALATGFLSSPSRLQVLALDHPNLIASAYPLVMIPVFLVPLSSILHGLCLWKLRRMSSIRATSSIEAASNTGRLWKPNQEDGSGPQPI